MKCLFWLPIKIKPNKRNFIHSKDGQIEKQIRIEIVLFVRVSDSFKFKYPLT